MKKKLILDTLYLAAMALVSLFYVFASFDKPLSGQLGFAHLLFTAAIITAFAVTLRTREGLPVFIYVLYAVAQCVAVFFWFCYFSATFHIFPGIVAINWLGLLIHVMLFAWSIGMAIFRKRMA